MPRTEIMKSQSVPESLEQICERFQCRSESLNQVCTSFKEFLLNLEESPRVLHISGKILRTPEGAWNVSMSWTEPEETAAVKLKKARDPAGSLPFRLFPTFQNWLRPFNILLHLPKFSLKHLENLVDTIMILSVYGSLELLQACLRRFKTFPHSIKSILRLYSVLEDLSTLKIFPDFLRLTNVMALQYPSDLFNTPLASDLFDSSKLDWDSKILPDSFKLF